MTAPAIAKKTQRTKRPTTYGTYLVRTPYSYCFRYRIPPDLHAIVGKKEIRYSLKTGYIGRAKTMSIQLAAKMQNLCATLREIVENQAGRTTIEMPKELSQHQIRELITEWVRNALKRGEQERIRPARPQDEDTLDDKYNTYDWVQTEHRRELAYLEHVESMGVSVDWFLLDRGISVDKDSDSYHQLCREALKVSIPLLDIEKQRLYGDYSGGTDEEIVSKILELQPTVLPPVPPASPAIVETTASIPLQDVISERTYNQE